MTSNTKTDLTSQSDPNPKCAFVTGLARTRTAWFAALINAHKCPINPLTQNVEAYHELLTKADSMEDYKSWLTTNMDSLTVDCSSVINYIPYAKVLVVNRSVDDVAKSLSALPVYADCGYSDILEVVVTNQEHLNNNIDLIYRFYKSQGIEPSEYIEFVDYDNLEDNDTVMECLTFLGIVPEITVVKAMQEMNVQAQYLKSITFEEFTTMGNRINSMFELNELRTTENKDDLSLH